MEKGWLFAPHPHSDGGKPLSWHSGRFDISFRFGASHADKLRACDYLKHSKTNLACSVETPDRLVSWDRLAQLSHLLSQGGGDWSLLKADREAVYKPLPIGPSGQRFAIVALRHPSTHLWYGFATRTLLIGSVASVVRYNAISRILAAPTNRCLGNPPIAYFDDFAAMIRWVLGDRSLSTFARFCTLIGFQMNHKKSAAGPAVFPCRAGGFPPSANNRQMATSLPAEKRKSWSGIIGGFLKEGRISHRCLENLIGKLPFSQPSLLRKFARAQMRPLLTKLNRLV